MAKAGLPDTPEARKAFMDDLQGWIIAWDPVKQAPAFKVDHKGPWNGGIVATAGNVLFQGLANGEFHAYDATNGKDLFSFDAQSGIIAPPVTYLANGKQYVAVETGWGGIYPFFLGGLARTSGWTVNHSRIIAFSLNGSAQLPPQNDMGFLPVKPPAKFDEKVTDKGYFQYQTYCAACHGDNGEGAGVLPDLRWSGAIRHSDAFYNVIGRGALTAYGMDRFDASMNPAEIDSIRQYLIKRANETYQREVDARQNARQIPQDPTLGLK
jgi:alcohol dehydrogenase (cytochrome c)